MCYVVQVPEMTLAFVDLNQNRAKLGAMSPSICFLRCTLTRSYCQNDVPEPFESLPTPSEKAVPVAICPTGLAGAPSNPSQANLSVAVETRQITKPRDIRMAKSMAYTANEGSGEQNRLTTAIRRQGSRCQVEASRIGNHKQVIHRQ